MQIEYKIPARNYWKAYLKSKKRLCERLTSITIEDCTSVLLYSQPLSQLSIGHDSFGMSESISTFLSIIFQSTAYLWHLSYTCSPFFCKIEKEKKQKKLKSLFFSIQKILRTWKFISSWMVIKNLWNYTAVRFERKGGKL